MEIKRITEDITGQEAADIIYDNDKLTGSVLQGATLRDSSNLFDVNNSIVGYYNTDDGYTLINNSGYRTSGFIAVSANGIYSARDINGKPGGNVYFYDNSRSYISFANVTILPGGTFTTPANTAFIRVTFNLTRVDINKAMVFAGSVAPSQYEPAGEIIDKVATNIIPDDIKIDNVKVNTTNFFNATSRPSANLFDKTNYTVGHYEADGNTYTPDSGYVTSDYVAIDGNTNFVKGSAGNTSLGTGYNYFYDSDKNILSVTQDGVITVPTGAVYIRVVVNLSRTPLDAFMLVAGTSIPNEYEPYGELVYSYTVDEKFLPSKSLGKSYKKYVAVGDSITWGFTPRNNPGTGTQLDSYAKLTGNEIAEAFVNAGISGSYMTSPGNSPMVDRISSLPDDADLITVMGGTNDFRNGVSLGTFADEGVNTYYGALKSVCQQLITKYQTSRADTETLPATIVLFTPFKMLTGSGWVYNPAIQNWVNAVKEVGAYYGLPVFDTNNETMVNPHIDRTLQGTNPTSPNVYNPLIPDGIHPSQQCHKMIAQQTVGYLRTRKY